MECNTNGLQIETLPFNSHTLSDLLYYCHVRFCFKGMVLFQTKEDALDFIREIYHDTEIQLVSQFDSVDITNLVEYSLRFKSGSTIRVFWACKDLHLYDWVPSTILCGNGINVSSCGYSISHGALPGDTPTFDLHINITGDDYNTYAMMACEDDEKSKLANEDEEESELDKFFNSFVVIKP